MVARVDAKVVLELRGREMVAPHFTQRRTIPNAARQECKEVAMVFTEVALLLGIIMLSGKKRYMTCYPLGLK